MAYPIRGQLWLLPNGRTQPQLCTCDADRRQNSPDAGPWTNHSRHVTLYLTSRGLTTSPIPHGTSTFETRFDFIDHELRILKVMVWYEC